MRLMGSCGSLYAHIYNIGYAFLTERDYVTFGSLLTQIRLSVCRLSVTLVHPILSSPGVSR